MNLNIQLELQGTMTIQKWREASNVCPPFIIFIFSGKINGLGGKGLCFFFKADFQLLSEEDIGKSHFATLTESRQ